MSKLKTYLIAAVAIGVLFTALASLHSAEVTAYKEQVVKEVTTEIQEKHDALIAEQLRNHELNLQNKLDEHAKAVELAEQRRDQYWETHFASKQADLIAQYESKLKLEGIKNAAKTIDNVLSPDTVRLLNESSGIVSTPPDYRYNFTGSETTAENSEGITRSLLSRLDSGEYRHRQGI